MHLKSFLFLFVLLPFSAYAENTEVESITREDLENYKHVIYQKEKQFNMKTLTVKVGEPVVFVNDDPIVHNVFSPTTNHSFNLMAQTPNSASLVIFKTPGTAKVFCAIHPKMALTITIEAN